MDDSMEFMSMAHDCLLSQRTASAERNTTLLGPLGARSGGGAIITPVECKPSAVFVDADASATEPLASSYEQRQLYAELDGDFDNVSNNDCMQQLYFDTPTKGTSLSPAASFASFDDHSQVFAEFFTTPIDEVVVKTDNDAFEMNNDAFETKNNVFETAPSHYAKEVSAYDGTAFAMDAPPPVGDWLEIAAPVDPNLGAILHEIRSEAAVFSREGSEFSNNSDDDEFEAALIGQPINESMLIGQTSGMESDDDISIVNSINAPKPKRTYSKRLGRPLTKDERRERKKAQNRAAAIRYRQKKMDNMETTESTLHQLQKRNESLKATIKTTQAEIEIMKRLMNDVRSAM